VEAELAEVLLAVPQAAELEVQAAAELLRERSTHPLKGGTETMRNIRPVRPIHGAKAGPARHRRDLALAIALPWLTLSVCALAADVGPDRELTPGATDPDATVNDHGIRDICNTKTGSVRSQLQPEAKREAFRRYNIAGNCSGFCSGPQGCEIDHLISLELGGANDPDNLWPQQYDGKPWNAHVKDKLENTLHDLVCAGSMTLSQAQTAISTDWIAAFKTYVGEDPSVVSSNGVARCKHQRIVASESPGQRDGLIAPLRVSLQSAAQCFKLSELRLHGEEVLLDQFPSVKKRLKALLRVSAVEIGNLQQKSVQESEERLYVGYDCPILKQPPSANAFKPFIGILCQRKVSHPGAPPPQLIELFLYD
jgi:hypothetical protein